MIAENRDYKETDSIKAAQSSMNSHPLWVTLCILIMFMERFYQEWNILTGK